MHPLVHSSQESGVHRISTRPRWTRVRDCVMATAPEKEKPTQRLRREKWGWNNPCVDLQTLLRSGSELTKGHQEKPLPAMRGGKWCIVVQLIVRLHLRGSSGKTPPSSGGGKWCIDWTPVPTFESFVVLHFIPLTLQYLPVLFLENSTTPSQFGPVSISFSIQDIVESFRWYCLEEKQKH